MKTTQLDDGFTRWLAADTAAAAAFAFSTAPGADSLAPSLSEGLTPADIAGAGVAITDYAAPLGRSDGAIEAPPDQPQENGTGDLAVAVAAFAGLGAFGNTYVNGILAGTRWSDGYITYSDPDSTADYGGLAYGDQDALVGLGQISATQLQAVHFGLNQAIYTQPVGAGGFSVEGFTNLGIDYAGPGTGNSTIRVADSADPGTAYAYYPSNANTGGDAFFGGSGQFPSAGNYDWHTVLHELGHSLGLKHGHEMGGPGNTALPAIYDSVEYSIMTYRSYQGDDTNGYNYGFGSAPQTFMMFDIMALQYMYGIDYNTRSGNDTYKWTPSSGDTYINGQLAIDAYDRIFLTIWDGNGIDTYDLTAYTTDLKVNLGNSGTVNLGTQLAYLGGGPGIGPDGVTTGYARANIFNSYNFNSDPRSLIERVLAGSGDDWLYGNEKDNYFLGNAGDDDMYGLAGNDDGNAGPGNDFADLGTGDDRMYGWNGNDELIGGTGLDRLIGDSGADLLNGGDDNDRLYGGSGDDALNGGAGADFIDGSGGNDSINGGTGNDRLQGRQGADNYFFDDNNDADRIFGFENDIDTLFISAAHGFANAAAVVGASSASGNNLFINLGGGNSINLWLYLQPAGASANDLLDDIVIF